MNSLSRPSKRMRQQGLGGYFLYMFYVIGNKDLVVGIAALCAGLWLPIVHTSASSLLWLPS
ncbi:hypothetical protein C21_00389 [Arenibacter sp. NBRC 103722]|nr:hypothetical protein C21_00389 [Arenibacter sp. NBRC 103722]